MHILGQRLIDWMINSASLSHKNAYYISQILLEMGVYIQIGTNPQHKMFQVMSKILPYYLIVSVCL